jgi:hypothetical protein
MPKQKIYAPEDIPKYLHRKGINVPLPEKKERKKRNVKAEPTKNEITELVGKMLAEASRSEDSSPTTLAQPVATDIETPPPVVVVEKKKRAREKVDPPKTKTMRGPRNKDATRAPNSWQIHLKDFRAKNPTISFKQAMADARATYVKV